MQFIHYLNQAAYLEKLGKIKGPRINLCLFFNMIVHNYTLFAHNLFNTNVSTSFIKQKS